MRRRLKCWIVVAGHILCGSAAAQPAQYFSHPTAAPLTGAEILGPVRQNGHDVSVPMSMIPSLVTSGFSGTFAPVAPIATGSTTARTVQDRAADQINVKDFGAVGDGAGGTDDSAAIAAAINRCLAVGALGKRSNLYFPTGTYRLSATTLPVMRNVPCGIGGDGVNKSTLAPDQNYSGDVLAYSDAWYGTSCTAVNCNTATLRVGPRVHDISIEGFTNATHPQIGIHFYDHNDTAILDNVLVDSLNSSCMVIGDQLNDVGSYMRESHFNNVRLGACGTATAAALEITAYPTTSAPGGGGDTTNQLFFVNLNVFPNGLGVRIRNQNAAKAVGPIRFEGLRIEMPLSGATGDNLVIGDATAPGTVQAIAINEFIGTNSNVGSDTIHVLGNGTLYPFDIQIQGAILNGNGNGVEVAGGSNLRFDLHQAPVAGKSIIVGAAPAVGRDIEFNLGLAASSVSTTIDATSLGSVMLDSIRAVGDPASGIVGVVTYPHDGSTKYGDPIGLGSVDFIGGRVAHNYAVTGAYSAGFGNSNAIQGPDAFAAGQLNVVGGSAVGAYVFGQANTVTGAFSNAAGLRVTDRGRYGYTGFGSGGFTGVGDGQAGHQLLRGVLSAATAVRLLADGTTIPNGTNSGFIASASHYHTKISASCLDTTALGWADWDEVQGTLDHPPSTGATYVGGYSAATVATRSSGALTGMTLTAAADATTQSISVTATPPSGNTDTIHCVSHLETREEVQ